MADDSKSSAFGRFIRHPLVLLLGEFMVFIVLYGLAGVAGSGIKALRNTPWQVLIVLVCAALAVWFYTWVRRRIEARPDTDFAGAGAGRELAAGLAIGFVLFSAAAGVVYALGGLAVEGLRGTGRLWSMIAMGIATGLFEEILFRGIAFRHLEAFAGSTVTLVVTSAFFGMAHLANPDSSWFAALAIALEAGILLGAAYMLTRRLWLACGIHAAWNFTQGWVWSAPVSGGKPADGLLVTHLQGPDWLSGGAFGLEASVPALVIATSAGLAMLGLAIRRGTYAALPWRARRAALA